MTLWLSVGALATAWAALGFIGSLSSRLARIEAKVDDLTEAVRLMRLVQENDRRERLR